jgi:hypothetical protein
MSEWIAEANRSWDSNKIKPEDLRSMGPEAVEFLEYSISMHVPGKTNGLGEWLPDSFRKYLPNSLYVQEPYGSHKQCIYALEHLSHLGPKAQPAIPLLVWLLGHEDNSLREAAAYGLNRIGPESWDEVESILGSTSSEGRRAILFTLTSRLSSPAPAPSQAEVDRILEIFLEACADPTPEIQMLGIGGLLNCQASYSHLFTGKDLPGRAGPVIAGCLNRGQGTLKVGCARALFYYPESVPLAGPALELMAAHSSKYISDPARAALQVAREADGQQ